MENFNQNFNDNENENFDNTSNNDTPEWNKVEFVPVETPQNNKKTGLGIKVFCIVMAGVVLLTATAATGYFLGKYNAVKNSPKVYTGKKVEVQLETKPVGVDPNTPSQIYDSVNESIVGIRVYNEVYDSSLPINIPPEASGVIYSEDGYIITNDHIYSGIGAARFKIFLHDGKEYDAVYVAGDVESDLAVLKIESEDKFKPAQFGDSDQLVSGEQVVAIGRPSGATDASSITMGVISLTKRRVRSKTSYSVAMIQTDSAINPGSSGGALVNMYGQVVGITSSKIAGEEYDAIGFAIPTRTMKRVVEQLILKGKVTDRAKLGISYTEFDSIKAELTGKDCVGLLIVDEVSKDSDVYGTVTEGDIITHVNGIEIINDDIMLDIIDESQPGDKIYITVLFKDGKQAELEVTLKEDIGKSSYSSNIRDTAIIKEKK